MSLPMVFNDFKEDCKIKKAVMDFSRKQNEFLIYIYCLEKDINVKKEKKDWKNYILNMDYHMNCAMDWSGGNPPP